MLQSLHVLSDANLFAGTGDPGQTVAVPQGELDLDVDPLRSLAADVSRSQPVVLVGLHDVAHLVSPHRSIPLIHDTDLLPLRTRKKKTGLEGVDREIKSYRNVFLSSK